MGWRRQICLMFSRRFRKIIYIVIVLVMVTLAICNRFGVNVSTNSRSISKESSNQVLLPKSVQLHKRDTRNPKNNRSLKRLSLDERVSNVHYVTIDPVKYTRKIVSSKNIKIESVDVKRKRESYKRAIRSQFQYTRTQMSNRDGLFNTGIIGQNNKIQKMQDLANSQRAYFGKTSAYIKGSIRFYAKPEWLSEDDIESMVTLSAQEIIRVENAKLHPDNNWKDLFISKDSKQNKSRNIHVSQQSNVKIFHGLTSHSLSLHEVLAFHLDRVLGLRRALPTVAKRITENAAKNLNIPDSSLHSILAIEKVAIQPVAGLIKRDVLACKSIQLSDPVSSKHCGNIDGLEWGKLALFDFLLQIHNRLNKLCCSFKPERNNKCLNKMETSDCSNPNMEIGTIHKEQNNNQLIFLENDMNLKSSGSIDYEVLQGVRKFPIRAVDIIRKRKLKLMLLQSLFIDKAYWDGVGGRPGVEDMINVIVHRAELFLEFYDKYNKVQ